MIRHVISFCLAAVCGSLPAFAQSVTNTSGDWSATYDKPVDRYGHAIMGDVPEWSRLCLSNGTDTACVTLPVDSVFEDMEPRLFDIDQDGAPEAITVESRLRAGAALVIYDLENGTINRTATPNIGTQNRWLAPIGVADFNNDGHMDVAYVDRPHLAQTLRVWTYRDATLTQIAALRGVTNHSIGEPFITSSMRTCDGRVEMILNDGRRQNIISVFFEGDELSYASIGPYTDPNAVISPPKC